MRRELLADLTKNSALQVAADALAARDEAAQKQRPVDAAPKPRRYELVPTKD